MGKRRIAEHFRRRETIADLQTEIEDMQACLAGLRRGISEFNEATAPAPIELDEQTRLILANYRYKGVVQRFRITQLELAYMVGRDKTGKTSGELVICNW